jgi:hypothetical protein
VNQLQNSSLIVGDPRSLSILVVEDHPDTRRALEMFLQLLGHQTKLAADGVGKRKMNKTLCRSDYDRHVSWRENRFWIRRQPQTRVRSSL